MATAFLEKTLETIIFETDNDLLQDRGLDISGKKIRQVRIGNYGIADLITIEKEYYMINEERHMPHLIVTIYELKKDKIDANTMMQAFRYVKGIQRYLKHRGKDFSIRFQAVLVGKELCMGDFCYLLDFIPKMTAVTYSYEFDGITFSRNDSYCLTKEGF